MIGKHHVGQGARAGETGHQAEVWVMAGSLFGEAGSSDFELCGCYFHGPWSSFYPRYITDIFVASEQFFVLNPHYWAPE